MVSSECVCVCVCVCARDPPCGMRWRAIILSTLTELGLFLNLLSRRGQDAKVITGGRMGDAGRLGHCRRVWERWKWPYRQDTLTPQRSHYNTTLLPQYTFNSGIYTCFIQTFAILLMSDSYITHYTFKIKVSQRCHRRSILVPQRTFKQTVLNLFGHTLF